MAINQNIFGYIPTESVDWSKAIGGLYTTVKGIEEGREELKLELDKLKTDNIKAVQQADNFTSQTFGQMMLGASQNGVTTIKAWNDALKRGELDPKEYKQRMNSLMENWGTLANNVKSFDTKNAEIQKQLQSGEISKASVEAGEYFARMGDLKNLQVFIDPSTGLVSTGRLDAKTGQVIPDTIESAKTTGDLSNLIFNKTNIDKTVAETTRFWKDYMVENNITTTSDLRQRDEFASKMADLTGALTSNNRMTLSILMDNTDEGYTTYYTNADRDSKLFAMVEKENQKRAYQDKAKLSGADLDAFIKDAEGKLIPMQKDASGVYQPMISEKQKDRAKKTIESAVALQLGYKSLQDEPKVAGGGSNNSPENEKLKYENLANGVIKNWNNSEWLSSQSKEYDFKWTAGGKLEVYKQVSDDRGGFDAALVQTIPNPTPETLGQYLGITTAQADNFKKSLDVARGTVNRTTKTTTKRLVSTTTKKKFN
jgi:hypothetical protein